MILLWLYITRTSNTRALNLDQRRYAHTAATRFGIENMGTTPAAAGIKPLLINDTLPTDAETEEMRGVLYREAVGAPR